LNSTLDPCTWPDSRLEQAFEALARRFASPAAPGREMASRVTSQATGVGDAEFRIEACARWHDLDVEHLDVAHVEVSTLLRSSAPALLRRKRDSTTEWLLLVKASGTVASLLGSDLRLRAVPLSVLRDVVCEPLESPLASRIGTILDAAAVGARYRDRTHRALLREQLRGTRLGGIWRIRPAPHRPFFEQLRADRVPIHAAAYLLATLTQQALLLTSWWLLGHAAFTGRLDSGWLAAWLLVLASMLALRSLASWHQGQTSIRGGALLKQRLLHGALNLEPEEVRTSGAGQFLGVVLESQVVEFLLLDAGFLSVLAVIELLSATVVLGLGAGGALHALLLVAWAGLFCGLGYRYVQSYRRWTDQRLAITHDLVERMVGHRTRQAQQPPERWHDDEDGALERYQELGLPMDRRSARMLALVSKGWLVLGLVALVPAVFGAAPAPERLAVSLGGILLAYGAFRRVVVGLSNLTGVVVAWSRIGQLFAAGGRSIRSESATFPLPVEGAPTETSDGRPLVDARGLRFRFRPDGRDVVDDCDLAIRSGDKVMIEGPSGSGKSTLVSLLSGLRPPREGLLLVGGLDSRLLEPERWRRMVATVPQFHENHVLTETFAFNLLMGHRWPPHAEDIHEATEICSELGLGDLLRRMPGGMFQMVGETGWQLSHGEKSRLYIARALLQRSAVLVLDESFAALDPETLRQCLTCVTRRAPSLVVIAHP
jgi:ATP-binding cassette subfamily B protein